MIHLRFFEIRVINTVRVSPTSKALLGFKSWTQSYRTVQVERSNHYAIETKYSKR